MANELKFFLSGGTSNTNPFNSNGGTISNTPLISGLLNNLWPDASEADTENGITDHKVIFVKNVSGSALAGMKAFFGESDQFVGMAILSTTTTNSAVDALASPTDTITEYFLIWQNAGESPQAQTSMNNTNKRVALYIAGVQHPAYNQFIDKIDILLAKTGSPTGFADVKIWAGTNTATDNIVLRTLGRIDVSTLTTSFVKYTFNTVAENPDVTISKLPSVGWRIGIEYSTGTSGNTVQVGQTNQTNTFGISAYTQGWDGSKWTDFAANLPCFNLYTNEGPCFQSGNPPPPGGGQPPPGECGTQPAAAGAIPMVGGGGGSADHGYPIVAETDNGNDGNGPQNAVDHNSSTRWSQNSTNAILTLDIGASHPIDRVKISWYRGNIRQSKFKLAWSTNNTTYTNIPAPNAAPNFLSSGTTEGLEEFSVQSTPGTPITARYIRYTGLGNTTNNWNSVSEFEIYGTEAPGPTPTPPPVPGGGGGINYSKPTSYATGIAVPDLNNNDFVAIHLERAIPPHTGHVDIENYSIVITNDANVQPSPQEPIPGGGPAGGSLPLPAPPGVFDPGVIPPPGSVEPPPGDVPGPCPGPPDTGGGGGTGTTPDGIKLAELPSGYAYGDHHQSPNENFKSDGSFRLDKGVQPQLDQVNLVVYLNLSSGSDEISGKLSGGTHTDGKAKNGRCYDIGVAQAGDRVRVRKEDPHPDTHDCKEFSMNTGSLNGKWVGFQYLKWNEGANCHLQVWLDTTGSETPTNQWQKVLDYVDTGSCFEPPYLHCFDASDSQTTVRVDGMSTSKFHYKFYDAVRITGP
jgi:hypothetical protein